ncbi:MAG: hypothetical protein A2161_20255 [Candidatus Schekmanbacteria bacterium RBG_13_48_7]|uniref:Antitoxin FitA-like ribbon-helix-helix domain-containing protein n=1 Tax=Candidatus Schekmanbacteria bacterium RBG_13_48_7 TaxID=1817878 RepID=A0A1F7RZT9_9BACT|nr:MAG: hypothetical protein A2161_20255 [Candidatus Schekmanbacteria bacterium RBG_13_48_7]
MTTITIKNIPDDLYEKLKKKAKENRRSINSEIILCIEQMVQSTRLDAKEFLKKIDVLMDGLNIPYLTDEFLKEAKDEGRL